MVRVLDEFSQRPSHGNSQLRITVVKPILANSSYFDEVSCEVL